MTKYLHASYVFIITDLVKLHWQCLGVSNFGNVKLSSAEWSAGGHEACYKIKCCSIICRLNKINFVSFVYYSLLVSYLHGIRFTETINLCEGVDPYWE